MKNNKFLNIFSGPKTRNMKKKVMLHFSFIIILAFLMLIALAGIILICKFEAESKTSQFIYSDSDKMPYNEFGLLLGTSKTTHGMSNPFFENRIKAAAELYHKNKIKYIIASGALHIDTPYDGPANMEEALIAQGVPADRIIKDGYGYRTLDSIFRARDVFGLDSFTVISQHSHIVRAVYIAKHENLNVVAYAADDCDIKKLNVKNDIRECFAKVKMMLDLYILNTQAKFPKQKLVNSN
jgi:SanA protein